MKLVLQRQTGLPIGIDIKIKENCKTLIRCDRVGLEALGFSNYSIPTNEEIRVRAKSLINLIQRAGIPKNDFSWYSFNRAFELSQL